MGQQTEVYDERAAIKSSRLYKKLVRIVSSHDPGDDSGTAISDILADLRHICDEQGWDFAEHDARAYGHYIEEVGSARRAEHAAEEAACRAARAGHAGIAEADL